MIAADRTFTASTLRPAGAPTFYFIGVTTGQSSIRRVFPLWAESLGLGRVEMVGIDLPLHAPDADYRRVVEFLANDPLSLGSLVTTHKLNLFSAARDLFDEIDPMAELMDEVSCISKREGRLRASAKDPRTAGLAVDAFLAPEAWGAAPRDLFIMGAGGSALALNWHLTRPERRLGRPASVTISNRSTARLDHFERLHARIAPEIPLARVEVGSARDNDRVLDRLTAGALVVNATGLGKDAPGSPLSDRAVFPARSIAWDLNYRGDLVFLEQARAQERSLGMTVVDGWDYFVHGWTSVIAEVFDVEIPVSGPRFDELSSLARGVR